MAKKEEITGLCVLDLDSLASLTPVKRKMHRKEVRAQLESCMQQLCAVLDEMMAMKEEMGVMMIHPVMVTLERTRRGHKMVREEWLYGAMPERDDMPQRNKEVNGGLKYGKGTKLRCREGGLMIAA